MPAVAYPHIEIDAQGDAAISGTQTKVLVVALDRLAYQWDAHEIQRQRPHLSLGQIHSALAYYYDHEAEMNARIDERLRTEEAVLGQQGTTRARAALLAARGDR